MGVFSRILAGAALLGTTAGAQDWSEVFKADLRGKPPPELIYDEGDAGAKQWLNTRKPLRLAQLKGRPVWVEFGFLG